jgi:hypothetical protein
MLRPVSKNATFSSCISDIDFNSGTNISPGKKRKNGLHKYQKGFRPRINEYHARNDSWEISIPDDPKNEENRRKYLISEVILRKIQILKTKAEYILPC